MKLEAVSGCGELLVCPTVYKTDRATAVIQGYRVNRNELDDGLDVPDREDLVEVPIDLVLDAAKRLSH